jgi:hypothetical protein
MANSTINNWESAISRLEESSNKLKLLLGVDWVQKIHTREGDDREIQEQFSIWKQSFIDIRSSLRPETIIPGIQYEELVDMWRELGQRDSYPVIEYIKMARDHYDDDDNDPECAELFTMLLNMPFFKPDHWLKKEDELKPLYIKGAGIPKWLSDRYREAVYSYVYGFNNAAIAMCRSIIEGIIRNRISGKYNNKAELKEMIEFYIKTVKETEHKQVAWSTHNIRILANDVLHDIRKSASDKSVRDTLFITRDFIREVY